MKALILAAGFGSRLQPITNSIPKAMVEINGAPLLVNTLNNLVECGVTEIGIVLGHMADYIKTAIGNSYRGVSIQYFENKLYLETNNIVSLYNASEFCNDDMLMLECDIYCPKETIGILIEGKGDCTILASPFNKGTMDGTVLQVEGDMAKELILGKWQDEDYDYSDKLKTVNMYRFNKNFAEKFLLLVKWYVENMDKNSYYEKILGSMIYYRECDIRVTEVPEYMWCEIDNISDIGRAEKIQ